MAGLFYHLGATSLIVSINLIILWDFSEFSNLVGGGRFLAHFDQKKFPQKIDFSRGGRPNMRVGVIFPYFPFSIDIFYEAFP